MSLLDGMGSVGVGWAPAAVAPTVVSMLGAAGSGRSTVCASAAAASGGVHLSPTVVLSEAVAAGHELGLRTAELLREGSGWCRRRCLWAELLVEAGGGDGCVGRGSVCARGVAGGRADARIVFVVRVCVLSFGVVVCLRG